MTEHTVQAVNAAADSYSQARKGVAEALSDPGTRPGALAAAAWEAEAARAEYDQAAAVYEAEIAEAEA